MRAKQSSLSFCILFLCVISTGVAADTYPTHWSQSHVSYTIGNGQSVTVPTTVTFTSSLALSSVSAVLTPSLADFVTVSPRYLSHVTPNVAYDLTLNFLVPPHAQPGTYDGTIHLKVGAKTISRPLPITITVDFGQNIVSPDTSTLSPSAQNLLLSLSTHDGTTTVVFSEWNEEFGVLHSGSILALPPSSVAPNGFLGKITDVSLIGGRVYMTAGFASLSEVFVSADVSLTEQLTPTDVVAERLATGAQRSTTAVAATADGFFIEMEDLVVYDADGNRSTKDDQITVDGSLVFSPTVDLTLKVRDWHLQTCRLVGHVRQQTNNLEFLVSVAAASLSPKATIAHYMLGAWTVWVGVVPVVITPDLELVVGLDGKVTLGARLGVDVTTTATSGLAFEDGTWTSIADHNTTFNFKPPQPSVGFKAKAYIGPELDILFYGLAGPYVDVGGFAELDVDVLRVPWWELYGGLQASAGAQMRILDKTIADYSVPVVIGYKKLLAQASTPPPTQGTLDQVNNPPWGGGATNVVPANQVGQSFTPTLPCLVGVDVNIQTANPGLGGDTLTLQIFGSSGQPLASVSQFVAEGSDGFLHFAFPTEVGVIPGQIVTMQLMDTSKNVFHWRYDSENTYLRGQAFFQGSPWYDFDFLFQTWGSSGCDSSARLGLPRASN